MSRPQYIDYGLVPSPDQLNISAYKQGHKCCGGCCDMRRAVIIVNLLMIFFTLIWLVFVLAARNVYTASGGGMINDTTSSSTIAGDDMWKTDDGVYSPYDSSTTEMSKPHFAFMIFLCFLHLAGSGAGIYGAFKYDKIAVICSLAVYMISTCYGLFTVQLIALFLNGFFAYPHIFLIREMHMGIMTEENYINEEFSCCCV
mmetsp:Transcript_36601/g.54574  ORF Transcript_36601/g.54574 Transcript_36601/m.54574 type:complete len:200 (-) Transcript_36601:198-797(-)|eukprot:CAMPEP_0194036126 /NCGR_PEP_ID=MMETSP0009_2-20130614/8500_1 /TAXON_ID=210454 /ORGANISM="Grammatophora oceanica, Strain CCMP 410" /LENGTH=199 /DNA_ID=CAMNT_0038677741 /DNA_START=73 /DNA_END=672 /DNA_ORIENTATION=-